MSGKCPRCTKTCYESEATKVMGQYYHPTCFKCKQCSKGLQLTDYTPEKTTNEVYCPSCHTSLFGPAGFRGGTASSIGVVSHSAVSGYGDKGPALKTNLVEKNVVTGGTGASASSASSSSSDGPKFCGGCGNKRDGTAKFCPNCGHKF